EQWARDYLEQLFLFAHLTLKWDDEQVVTPGKLRATAAMMGVATEALSETGTFHFWSEKDLRVDGSEILQLLNQLPEQAAHELASMWRVLRRMELPREDTLWMALEQTRATLVREHFHEAAEEAIRRLDSDHEVY